ncbi:hypothetical protein J6X90_00645 [Candidatus Saccharibacteria bacterium]|nr:hypothetical protein [Candidatus Saccharibacteria bacterium]
MVYIFIVLLTIVAVLIVYTYRKLEREKQEKFRKNVEFTALNNASIEAKGKEVTELDKVRAELELLAQIHEEVEPFLILCVRNLDTLVASDGERYDAAEADIVKNSKDILSICYDNRFGKKIQLEQCEMEQINKLLINSKQLLVELTKNNSKTTTIEGAV